MWPFKRKKWETLGTAVNDYGTIGDITVVWE